MYNAASPTREVPARSVPSLILEATKRLVTAKGTASIDATMDLPCAVSTAPLDAGHIREYMVITRQPDLGHVPPLYYFTRAFRGMATILGEPESPVRMFGIMHRDNLLTVNKAVPIDEDAILKVSIWLSQFEQGEKGQDLKFMSRFTVDNETVATMETVAFLRNRRTKSQKSTAEPGDLTKAWEKAGSVSLEKKLGWKYAKNSDDWNPFHITKGLARVFGAKSMFLQGACSAGIVMGQVPDDPVNKTGIGMVRTAFLKPVHIPGTQDMYSSLDSSESGERIHQLWDPKKERVTVVVGLSDLTLAA